MQWKLFADLAERAGDRVVVVDVGSEATVREALGALLDAHPDLAERVLDEQGELHDHINVLRNGESVDDGGLDTLVDDDDELALFPPVSGG